MSLSCMMLGHKTLWYSACMIDKSLPSVRKKFGYSISQEICTRFCWALLCCGNLTIAPVPAKQPWWIWINTSCEFIMNDCITTAKQSTTKPCAYFLGYTVVNHIGTYESVEHHRDHCGRHRLINQSDKVLYGNVQQIWWLYYLHTLCNKSVWQGSVWKCPTNLLAILLAHIV